MSSSLSAQQALLASSVAVTVVTAVSFFTYQKNKREEKSYPIDSHVHGVHTNATIDAAVQQEKARTEVLQALEKDMDVEGLKRVLTKERAHSFRLTVDLATLRSPIVQSQADAEVHKEGGIKDLMRLLKRLQQEKGRIIFDPNRPKRNMTALYLYSKANRAKVKANNPEASIHDIDTILAKEFNALIEKDRKKWDEKATKDSERYQEDMVRYNATLA
eukprot:scaffold6461_cov48-Attheya_sp.AAC.5